MAHYMLLLYAPEVDPAEQAERSGRCRCGGGHREPARRRPAGASSACIPTESATTVRVRGGETELTDGPFAVTKEVLAGYYILSAPISTRRSGRRRGCRSRATGSIEVRPIMSRQSG